MRNNFEEQLAWSQKESKEPWWDLVYQSAFPDLSRSELVTDDGPDQRNGIDRRLYLTGGKVITVDEKVRKQDWPDFFLEVWSSYESRRPGWMAKSLHCDFIAYAFKPSKRCYLLPFHALRLAYHKHGKEWFSEYCPDGKFLLAPNRSGFTTYRTAGIPVPIDVLLSAMTGSMIIDWNEREDQ